MANTIFNEFLSNHADTTYGWDSGTTVRAMLITTEPTTVDPDYTVVQDLIDDGMVELVATGYSRVTLTNKIVFKNNTTDKIEYRCDNLNFGDIASGSTVQAILLFIRVGTSDDASTDIPLYYINDADTLPQATGGGAFVAQVPTTGLFQLRQGVAVTTTTTTTTTTT